MGFLPHSCIETCSPVLLSYLLTFSNMHKGSILELENSQAELRLDFEGHLTGSKRCHGLSIDITLQKGIHLTTVDWRWVYIVSILREGDWSSGRLKGSSGSIQQTFTEPILPDRCWTWLLYFPKRMTQVLSSKIWGNKVQWPIFIMSHNLMSICSLGDDAHPPPAPVNSFLSGTCCGAYSKRFLQLPSSGMHPHHSCWCREWSAEWRCSTAGSWSCKARWKSAHPRSSSSRWGHWGSSEGVPLLGCHAVIFTETPMMWYSSDTLLS